MNIVAGATPGLDRAVERLWDAAPEHDRPDADLAALLAPLFEAGLFKAAAPAPYGEGLATDPAATAQLLQVLRRVGGANLSAGRLLEGHFNAVKLVFAFGDPGQKQAFGRAVAAGAASGVWNAEAPPGLKLDDSRFPAVLAGKKIYCSGAGFLTAPLVTARTEAGGVSMVLTPGAAAAPRDLSGWRMRGMRATATGTVDLTGVAVAPAEIMGAPGDYYHSPGFRGGAWRFCAVQWGAIERIAFLMRQALRSRARYLDPHQRARTAAAAIAAQTAGLWVTAAASQVEDAACDPREAETCAGMARTAVEQSALRVIELAERSLGLSAFAEAEPIERVVRDLATYLRQPFPDAVVDDIAGYYFDAEPGVHPAVVATCDGSG